MWFRGKTRHVLMGKTHHVLLGKTHFFVYTAISDYTLLTTLVGGGTLFRGQEKKSSRNHQSSEGRNSLKESSSNCTRSTTVPPTVHSLHTT